MGVKFTRVFSRPDVNPYDEIKWKESTAEIKGSDGKVLFRQAGVSFPDFFSQTAINIVASKYFYGDVNAPNGSPASGGREYSFNQLVHRVAQSIRDFGVDNGYFEDDESADVFYDELSWLLLNQYGSFNSPVWFNVGLSRYGVEANNADNQVWATVDGETKKVDPYRHPQASACFIVEARDSIEGIWELMGESARLFKYGSGVGADWSRLRSSKDTLSGGGQPSGPVSFMRVQDATGGTIKSGGKTRRAAIMQTLSDWHPDIEEFIGAKMKEELKAHALIDAGYDGSYNGDAYTSVGFQNVNQSVRVSDEFMLAAGSNTSEGSAWPLKSPATGKTVEMADARELMRKIAEGTWICGDPGLQYSSQISRWHTCKNTDDIRSSNPCSEFVFLDNTSCNLASLNLRRFQDGHGLFDAKRFSAATRIFIMAQEILVDLGGYPSWEIARNSHDFRPLGLGYANLGALLMSRGIPYDSNEGRAYASAIMALEHFEAYAMSSEIAMHKGAFRGYKANAKPFMDVMNLHRDHAISAMKGNWTDDGWIVSEETSIIGRAACEAADRAVELGSKYGYRNAQVTVLAPTGTISFMMDCDTTGIEPAIALVSYKLLAGKGDGMIKLVNNTVKEALDRLGYDTPHGKVETAADEIIAYIEKHDTIEGAPHLKEEHLPVFDCAFKPAKGERSIHYEGHIKMMAAVQPFISGAISKTVNMPESATVEEIQHAYEMGWRLGLKAIAIYRENSKRSQPLSTSLEEKEGSAEDIEARYAEYLAGVRGKAFEEGARSAIGKERRRLPDERPAFTYKFSVGGQEGYLNVGLYPDTMQPGEIFVTMAKEGSTMSGLMDAFATMTSIALQYGVPLEDLCRKFSHLRFEPSGFTNDPDVRNAKSIIDYIFRKLEAKFVSPEAVKPDYVSISRSGISSSGDSNINGRITSGYASFDRLLNDGIITLPANEVMNAGLDVASEERNDSPPCGSCGSITVRSGACYTCQTCGSTTGCG